MENHKNSYNTPYKFNGKELDSETGYYYYGARYYNPRISLWLNVDPLAEKYPSYSPYVYTLNNPIVLTDPDGREPGPTPMWNYYNILQGGSLRFIRKVSPDPWSINTFFGSVNLPNPGATNFHILAVGFDEMVFSSHKQMAIYANAIDWDYFNETKHLRFNETSVYQGETYKIGKTPPTLSEVRDNISAIQELSCNCGAVLMGVMGASSLERRGSLEFADTVSKQKMIRHIEGTAPNNKSYFNSIDEAQAVLDAYNSGNYTLISENISQSTVNIQVKGVTGRYVNVGNPNGRPDINVPTNKFMIQSTTSPKVVPINPKK